MKNAYDSMRTYMGVADVPVPSAWKIMMNHVNVTDVLGLDSVCACLVFTCLFSCIQCLTFVKRVLLAVMIMPPALVVSVEGNIGSGKSTLIRSLADSSDRVRFVLERTGRMWWWLLKKGSSSSLWLINFQLYVMLTQLWEFTFGTRLPVVLVMERSVTSGVLVFVKHAFNTGALSRTDVAFLVKTMCIIDCLPHMYAFLDTPVDQVVCNVRKRGRKVEANLDVVYLRDLDDLHHDMRKFLVHNGVVASHNVLDARKDIHAIVRIVDE